MAVDNTLTDLIPTIYSARDQVSRELVGMIPSVLLDANSDRCAVGKVIRSFAAPSATTSATAPASTVPNGTGDSFAKVDLVITDSESKLIPWTGEDHLRVNEAGVDLMLADQIAQVMRTLVNKAELNLATKGDLNASRGYGTAGTAPFATTLAGVNNIRQILVDNGAGTDDLNIVTNTTAGTSMRNLGQLSKANEAGGDTLLRRGVLLDVSGVAIRESGQIVTHTAGTAASATTNNAGYAVGATTITLASAGTGTILAGDCLTFAGDANIYVVKTGDSDVSNGGTIVLQEPGLRVAMSAATKAITMIATHASNLGFRRGAMGLALRPPNMGRDLARDSMLVKDKVSGITFDVREYAGFGMVQYFVGLAWGSVAWKPEHIAKLIG